MLDQQSTTRRRRWPWIVGLALLPLALAGILILVFGETGASQANQAVQAEIKCQEHVKGELKAPATAQFPAATVDLDADGTNVDTYRVSGGVDAQNSYGALVRTPYTCTVAYNTGQWSLISLAVGEDEIASNSGYLPGGVNESSAPPPPAIDEVTLSRCAADGSIEITNHTSETQTYTISIDIADENSVPMESIVERSDPVAAGQTATIYGIGGNFLAQRGPALCTVTSVNRIPS